MIKIHVFNLITINYSILRISRQDLFEASTHCHELMDWMVSLTILWKQISNQDKLEWMGKVGTGANYDF